MRFMSVAVHRAPNGLWSLSENLDRARRARSISAGARMVSKDRRINNCRVFKVVITLRRDDMSRTLERDDYLDGTTLCYR